MRVLVILIRETSMHSIILDQTKRRTSRSMPSTFRQQFKGLALYMMNEFNQPISVTVLSRRQHFC